MTWTTRPRSKFGPLAAITAGQGPCVMLLHGVGLRAEAWAPQIDTLASAGFSVIAPDMLGHGGSAAAGSSLAEFVVPLSALLNQPTVVIGHSMGAMLALELAAAHPEHIKGVAALNAIFRRSDTAKHAVQARAAALDGNGIPDPEDTLTRWFGAKPSPARHACHEWLTNVDPQGYRAAYGVFAQADGPSDASLAQISCPALFLTGADEPNSTPQMSRNMAERVKNGRAVVIEGAAHMVPMTHSDTVNAQLVRFAKECLT
ncbi:alpha/beta fold hydrolase [Thalassovita sp.]|uniref:alpha/beta fold hydrolase n=1 Tax=Thalassovita sp. TaxID=1979401 RepID=UPI003B5A7DFF